MYDVRDEDELQQWKESKHPWTSPGSSPVFGNGCGASGGAPFGCLCQDDTPLNNCFGDDTRPYGSCCGAPNAEVLHELIMLQTFIKICVDPLSQITISYLREILNALDTLEV